MCYIANALKNLISTADPEVDVLSDQIVKENQPLSVQCKANGNPEPTSYTWTRSKDGLRQTQSTIFIHNTRREDTDTYICTAHNVMRPTVGVQTPGVGSERMNVKILCTYATIYINDIFLLLSVYLSVSLTLPYTCTAHNVMRPTVGIQTPCVGYKRMNVKILCTYATIM